MKRYGYNGRILWIDLTDRSFRIETPDENFWRLYGGGGLAAAYLLLRETAPGIDPLDPDNLLIFASSVVAGLDVPGTARFTTSAKSPLTGGIGETRTEGSWGPALKGSGADIIVIRGASDTPVMVEVIPGHRDAPRRQPDETAHTDDCGGTEDTHPRVIFHDAMHIWGKTVGEATDEIEKRLGTKVHTAAIGPAGENLVRFASIVTDRSFQASRMGMGAVMGSKRLKAVVLREGTAPEVADPAALARIGNEFRGAIPQNSLSRWQFDPPGFSCWIYLHGLDASICVENYSKSEFSELEAFEETRYKDLKITDLPCPGCPNNCIKSIQDPAHTATGESDYRAAGIHQEITGAMGPNLGIGNLSFILRANTLCNQYGLDPTSLGFTISFAMECFREGIITARDNGGKPLRFGSTEDALRIIEDIAFRRGLGDILAEGSKRAAERLGGGAAELAMHVKGLEMVPFEPRSQTNLALGYAVAPIGPRYDICEHDWDFDTEVGWDHTLRYSRTLGILERIPMGYMGPKKVRNFKALHSLWSAADALDMCIFAVAPTRILSMPVMAELLGAATGWETSAYELMRFGERRVHLMRWYNLREGLTTADDSLPIRFYNRPIEGGPQAGAVLDRVKFTESIRTFYAMMGWDENGVPLRATLYDAGLGRLLESL